MLCKMIKKPEAKGRNMQHAWANKLFSTISCVKTWGGGGGPTDVWNSIKMTIPKIGRDGVNWNQMYYVLLIFVNALNVILIFIETNPLHKMPMKRVRINKKSPF